eukprot:2017258-Prymnesium_polylepis.1
MCGRGAPRTPREHGCTSGCPRRDAPHVTAAGAGPRLCCGAELLSVSVNERARRVGEGCGHEPGVHGSDHVSVSDVDIDLSCREAGAQGCAYHLPI